MMSDSSSSAPRELALSAASGDQNAAQVLIERYHDELLGRVRRNLGRELRDFAQSMDHLQDLFVDILRDFDPQTIRTEKQFLRWAGTVLANNLRDQSRKRRHRKLEELTNSLAPAEEVPHSPASVLVQKGDLSKIEEAMARLPPDFRQVIELRDLEGLSYALVAERMDRPTPDAARRLRARALSRLATLVQRKPR